MTKPVPASDFESAGEKAGYIADMLVSLRRMAGGPAFAGLKTLLQAAENEAHQIGRRPAP